MTPQHDGLLDSVLADLKAEGDQLWAVVSGLDEVGWHTPTAAEGWDVATQVAHLAWTDEVAVLAATDKAAWDAVVLTALENPEAYVDTAAREIASLSPQALLARWGAARDALTITLRGYPQGERMPWFGPPMSPATMGTARFMETWAHGLDVYAGLGIDPETTDRIRHVAHLGVRTRNHSFVTNGLDAPLEEFKVTAHRAVRRVLVVGSGRGAAVGARLGPRLLPARHPAHQPRRHRPGGRGARREPLARHRAVLRRPAGRGETGAMTALVVGNCSGFYGDRLTAMREQLEGGHLDVLTGDYLAELTMLILGKDAMRDASLGYARTFVRQLEDCLGLALERGVRIVSNAGGLNPAGLAERLREVARGIGLDPAIAYVEGDDLRPVAAELGLGEKALTVNAYLGGFGIASALHAGADVVVTGRVTDASLVVGAAIAHHGWSPTAYDELAGATVAGHVLECGCQATGGNFSGFRELVSTGSIAGWQPLGFPIAEIAADGSSVITKHDGTGGAVTVDTVTAQLVYEIQSTRYLGPDVTTRLDTVVLEQAGSDRVAITGTRGEAPPRRLKVCVNELGGFRNSVEFLLTGLDLDAKKEWVRSQLARAWGDRPPQTVIWHESHPGATDSTSWELATSVYRCVVLDPSPDVAGKGLTGPAVEIALASYPGFTLTAPPTPATPYGIYRPAYVDRSAVTHTVVHADGRREVVPDPEVLADEATPEAGLRPSPYPAPEDVRTRRLPLGTFVHARSGDKGGDANLGLWVTHTGDAELYAARFTWLAKVASPVRIRELVPEARDLEIDVFLLPNLGAVNVVIHGLLGDGVAASTRIDPQAKALGEWVRSRLVAIDESLL